eukprot:1409938-Amphidinium_carterae.1
MLPLAVLGVLDRAFYNIAASFVGLCAVTLVLSCLPAGLFGPFNCMASPVPRGEHLYDTWRLHWKWIPIEPSEPLHTFTPHSTLHHPPCTMFTTHSRHVLSQLYTTNMPPPQKKQKSLQNH